MKTVYESLVTWLNEILTDPENEFPETLTVIDLEQIPNWQEFQNAGLFSSPNDIQVEYMGGQIRHTEFKSLYLRLSFKEFSERLRNETFLEKFRRCINKKALSGIMPSDGRKWLKINCNGSIYPAHRQENNEYADYLVPLAIEYFS